MLSQILGIPPFQMFFGLPYYLLRMHNIISIAVQLAYSYVLACIYAAAYVSIEAHLRKNYPLMTWGEWKKRHHAAEKPARRKKR
jgi:formate hydrogenlyase subunit 3/multisubunit Na+/H+ antiporter MnhD subunit